MGQRLQPGRKAPHPAEQLAGAPGAGHKGRCRDGGVGEDGQPLAPQETQQALHNEVKRYEIDSVATPVDTTNRYTVTIPETDLVGKNLSEMALIDADGVFAAVKNFLPKGKDEDVRFTFEFDDEF